VSALIKTLKLKITVFCFNI